MIKGTIDDAPTKPVSRLLCYFCHFCSRQCVGCCSPADPHLTLIFLSSQSLCGCSVTVSTIDGKTCNMKITDVVKPGMRKTVAGQGLPFPKNPEQRGDLVVEFDVNFPESLPTNARDVLKRHLPA